MSSKTVGPAPSPFETKAIHHVIMNELIQEDIMVIGSDYRVLDINEPMLEKLGLDREDAIGRYCYEITHHQDTPCSGEEHPCPLIQTLETRKPSQTTHIHLDKDNNDIFYSISCYPLLEDGEAIGAIEISRDITRDITLQKIMMQQEKLASIGRLSAGVAHEVNNPLTTILTTALLIQEDIEADDPMFEDLETIARETLRCRKIVTSLLDFARQTKPEKREHKINDIVEESILLTKKQAAFKDVGIDYHFSGEIPLMRLDKGQIQQALINLLLNAVEATGADGEIRVRTDWVPSRKTAVIAIQDTGRGIPADKLDSIFDPFFTTKETGTGLGLAITHGIVEQHGGAVEVESAPGKGTTFTITLPRNGGDLNA
jgi:two-component system, NtrC family, sensor kinase